MLIDFSKYKIQNKTLLQDSKGWSLYDRTDTLSIITDEPLRGLPNGVRDTVKMDGSVVRRIGKAVLDGSENGGSTGSMDTACEVNNHLYIMYMSSVYSGHYDSILADKLPTSTALWSKDVEGIMIGTGGGDAVRLKISNTKTGVTPTDTNETIASKIQTWLKANPITIYYELATPVIEPPKRPLILQGFEKGSILTTSGPTSPYLTINYASSLKARVQTLEKSVDLLDSSIASKVSIKKNRVINGNFDVWQRGTNHESANFGNVSNRGAFTADRWWVHAWNGDKSTDDVTWNVSRQTFDTGQNDVPNNPRYYLRYSFQALSSTHKAGQLMKMSHTFEDVRLFSNGRATLSFHAKADKSRKMAVCVDQRFIDASTQNVSADGTEITLGTTWKKYTITFDIPSLKGKDISAGGNLVLSFMVYKYDNTTSKVPNGEVGDFSSGSIDFAQVQFVEGSEDVPFQSRTFAEELLDCKRYFQKSYDYHLPPGTNTNNGMFFGLPMNWPIQPGYRVYTSSVPKFEVEMRDCPYVTLYTKEGVRGKWFIDMQLRWVTADMVSTKQFVINNDGEATFTPSATSEVYGHWTADCEL